ncbi:spondin-1-like isoform X2 [Bradysia coprophila]|nr:spondin-1-like isoform X2 [Bradysia coprophila]
MLLPTDSTRSIVFIILLLNTNFNLISASKCNRTPEGHGALNTPADGRFRIRIVENDEKYTPGKTYTIKLEGIDIGQRTAVPALKYKFSGFMLVVENMSNESMGDHSILTVGTMSIPEGDTLTKITCSNMVSHTTTTSKSEIQIKWKAPQVGSGCVVFKATVIEHRDVWYMDDGPLTKEFCEEQRFDDEFSVPVKCTACTEAKYELTFEGLWSRNTHPKDFPSNVFSTKFSDIIGASHTASYSFWKYGETASDGLKQVAENGFTTELEEEIKSQSSEIRTIIKAKGLEHPNLGGKTFAVFRVDRDHSQLSFVSMIHPSPDWFLGVSGLELCTEEGGWIESRTLDLCPWDAGTDSGPKYDSPNEPTIPREFIRRIRADYPNDPRSPFYDPNSNLKPLARLYVSRQRVYEKDCPAETDDSSQEECATGSWEETDECDVQCGKGNKHLQRHYLNEHLAIQAGCNVELTREETCYGRNCGNHRSDESEEATQPSCALTGWSDWSECSVRCGGTGHRTKTRSYLQRSSKEYCQSLPNAESLELLKPCNNPCSGTTTNLHNRGEEDQNADSEEVNNKQEKGENEAREDRKCQTSGWSRYGPCSVACGGGFQIRTKTAKSGICEESDLQQKRTCNEFECDVPPYCREFPDVDPCTNVTNRWLYNWDEKRCEIFSYGCGEHQNRFLTYENCSKTCSEWNPMFEIEKNQLLEEQRRRDDRKGSRRG